MMVDGYQATASLASRRPLLRPDAMARALVARYCCDECGAAVRATIGSVRACRCGNILWYFQRWVMREFADPPCHTFTPTARLLPAPPL